MSRIIQSKAKKGSQKWLQLLINDKPEIINQGIYKKLGIDKSVEIKWLSPLKNNEYAEYSDNAFLKLLQVDGLTIPLEDFWPKHGPVWDGLAIAGNSKILVEAKAHISEIVSKGSGAGNESLRKINDSLNETKRYLGVKSKSDWSGAFYQYANRLAHLYYLRILNNIDAHLVFVYFINDMDMNGPTSRIEWEGAINLLHSFLGASHHKLSSYVHDIFIDINGLRG